VWFFTNLFTREQLIHLTPKYISAAKCPIVKSLAAAAEDVGEDGTALRGEALSIGMIWTMARPRLSINGEK
jgi:hypothetical protein